MLRLLMYIKKCKTVRQKMYVKKRTSKIVHQKSVCVHNECTFWRTCYCDHPLNAKLHCNSLLFLTYLMDAQMNRVPTGPGKPWKPGIWEKNLENLEKVLNLGLESIIFIFTPSIALVKGLKKNRLRRYFSISSLFSVIRCQICFFFFCILLDISKY